MLDRRTREALGLLLTAIRDMEHRIMSGLSDLQAAVTAEGADLSALEAEQATFLTDITAALSNGDSDAAVEDAAQTVLAYRQRLQALAAAQLAADPGAPVTAPTASTTTTVTS
jgi:hypothetical protein